MAHLVDRFDVIVDEADGHEHQLAHPLLRQQRNERVGVRLTPLGRADPALEGELDAPFGEPLPQPAERALQLPGIGIAALDVGDRQAMGRAQDDRPFRRKAMPLQALPQPLR